MNLAFDFCPINAFKLMRKPSLNSISLWRFILRVTSANGTDAQMGKGTVVQQLKGIKLFPFDIKA